MEIHRIWILQGMLSSIINCLDHMASIRNDISFFHPDSVIAQNKRLKYYNDWMDYFTKIILLLEFAFIRKQQASSIKIVNLKMTKI